jgi:integrase
VSVRREKRRNRKLGAEWEILLIDFTHVHPDGRRERIRRVAQGTTRREAEAEERAIRRVLDDGAGGRERKVQEAEEKKAVETLSEFSKTFIKLHAVPNCKPRTADLYRQLFRLYLLPELGPIRLDAIGALEADKLKAKLLGTGLGRKSVRNALALLSKVLHYAEETGIIDSAPKVKLPPAPATDVDFFDFDEADRLLAAAAKEKEPVWYAAILLALRSGLRRGELFELRWKDVDLDARRIDVRRSHSRGHTTSPKSNRGRSIAMSSQTVAVLTSLRKAQVRSIGDDFGANDFVLAGSDRTRISKSAADRALARICSRAGLRELSWHKLRHSCASHLIMRGTPLRVVQEVLGHATLSMVLKYAHLAPQVTAQAIESLDLPWTGHGNIMATARETSGNEVVVSS